MKIVIWAFILINIFSLYIFGRSNSMLNQIEDSVSYSNESFEVLEESNQIQRSLSLVGLGISLNQDQVIDKAISEVNDEEFKESLQKIRDKRNLGEPISQKDLLEISALGESKFLSAQEMKNETWADANDQFSSLISNYQFNTKALVGMQVTTLILFLGLLFFQRSKEKIEASLRKQEKLQSQLFSNLSEGIFLCNGEGKIIACNSSGSFIAGKEARFLNGKNFSSLFEGLELKTEENKKLRYKDFFEKVFVNGRSILNYSISVTSKSGYTNWYSLTTQPISPFNQNESHNMLLSFNNITEKVMAQKQVKQQQVKMMEGSKLQTIGEMVGGIAHEIDNPLSIIMATTERLDSKAERKGIVEGETIRKSTGKVLKTVDRISSIVKSLLSMAREEEVEHTFVTLQDILDITFDLANIEITKKNIELKIESNVLNEVVECFPTQIAQVLLNLTKNSVDAIEDLEEKWIKLEVQDLGDHFKFTHTDSGRGIPKDIADKALLPFFTTKEVGKGTGLGLSICRNIITAHNGEFKLNSNSPNTSFTFTLPKKHIESKEAA